uniref:Uncharacterized protein n=1 Tax=Geospiza parvula TaxID=87175 RepID=A0A8U8ATG6_GEOPR
CLHLHLPPCVRGSSCVSLCPVTHPCVHSCVCVSTHVSLCLVMYSCVRHVSVCPAVCPCVHSCVHLCVPVSSHVSLCPALCFCVQPCVPVSSHIFLCPVSMSLSLCPLLCPCVQSCVCVSSPVSLCPSMCPLMCPCVQPCVPVSSPVSLCPALCRCVLLPQLPQPHQGSALEEETSANQAVGETWIHSGSHSVKLWSRLPREAELQRDPQDRLSFRLCQGRFRLDVRRNSFTKGCQARLPRAGLADPHPWGDFTALWMGEKFKTSPHCCPD